MVRSSNGKQESSINNNENMREEDKLIWTSLNAHEKNFKRIDNNTFVLFIPVIISLVLAIIK